MISDKRPNLHTLSEEEERTLKKLSSLRNSDSMAYKSTTIQEYSRSVEMRENWADILNGDVGIGYISDNYFKIYGVRSSC